MTYQVRVYRPLDGTWYFLLTEYKERAGEMQLEWMISSDATDAVEFVSFSMACRGLGKFAEELSRHPDAAEWVFTAAKVESHNRSHAYN